MSLTKIAAVRTPVAPQRHAAASAAALVVALVAAMLLFGVHTAHADSMRDEAHKTSTLVMACVDVTGQSDPMSFTKYLAGVQTRLSDADGAVVGTRTSDRDGYVMYPGLAWGKTYTFEITSVPQGRFEIGHGFKAGATGSYSVEVSNDGWVTVDGKNGNDAAPSSQFPGVNHLGGKTPFKLFFDTVPAVEKTVNGQEEAHAKAGEELVFEVKTTLSAAVAYSFSARPVADIAIAYGSVELSDELDAAFDVKNAEVLLDGASVDGDAATTSMELAEDGKTLIKASMTKEGIESLRVKWPTKGTSHEFTLRITASLKPDAHDPVENTGAVAIDRAHGSSNTVVVVPPPSVDVAVVKTWADATSYSGVSMQLKRNGVAVEDPIVLDGTVDAVEKEAWHAAWTRLPKFDENGDEYRYEVEESYVDPEQAKRFDTTYDYKRGEFAVEATVTNTAKPEPKPDPDPEPGPNPDPEPAPNPDPQPAPDPDPAPDPAPSPDPKPAIDPVPVPNPGPSRNAGTVPAQKHDVKRAAAAKQTVLPQTADDAALALPMLLSAAAGATVAAATASRRRRER